MTARTDRLDRPKRRQVGALCWRPGPEGPEILMITSRDTGRWVTPKGNPMSGVGDARAAAQEALEEAGVAGELHETSLGVFHYHKRLSGKARRLTAVDLYPLRVTAELDTWDEAHQRERRWFAPEAAAAAVDEPELKTLIRDFRPAD